MNSNFPDRKRLRLPKYDYSSAGCYFITICARQKCCIFGRIISSPAPQLVPSPVGAIIEQYIRSLPAAYPTVALDNYVIMPNHVHLLLRVADCPHSASNVSSPVNISNLVGCLKRFTNRDAGEQLWQRSYYDHIVRNESDYLRIWQYIEENPAKWPDDEYFDS